MSVTTRMVRPLPVGRADFVPGSRYKGPVLPFRTADDPASLGVWWWESSLLLRPDPQLGAGVDDLLDMLVQSHVNELYLSLGRILPWEPSFSPERGGDLDDRHLAGFIEKCGRLGIRVSALTGDGGLSALRWFDPERDYPETRRYLDMVAAYNARVAASQRLYGVHLDLEPCLDDDRPRHLQWISRFLQVIRTECDRRDLLLEMDINAWYGEKDLVETGGTTVNILDVFTTCCHSLGIMAYRPSAEAQMAIARYELGYGIKNGCHMVVGCETMTPADLGEEAGISYYTVGAARFCEEQARLRELLRREGGNVGAAVHWANAWYVLNATTA